MKVFIPLVVLVLALVVPAFGSEFAANVEFGPTSHLEPDLMYELTAHVSNTSLSGGGWIDSVEIYMPTFRYVIHEFYFPDSLHSGEWTAYGVVGEYTDGIRWEFLSSPEPNIGDIPEGESLDFVFRVTSDGVDGFPWVIYSDTGATVSGVARAGSDDDDTAADDDLIVDDDTEADDSTMADDDSSEGTDDDTTTQDDSGGVSDSEAFCCGC